MYNAKSKVLEGFATRIRYLLLQEDIGKSYKLSPVLESLEKKYQIINREYKTWPFRKLEIAGFSISAITPIVGTIISGIIDQMIKKP